MKIGFTGWNTKGERFEGTIEITVEEPAGASDIMAHIMERYFTNEPDVDMTDRLCESVLKTILKQAPVCVQDPTNYAARAEMMWASTVAHNDFLTCFRVGDWASHQRPVRLHARRGPGRGLPRVDDLRLQARRPALLPLRRGGHGRGDGLLPPGGDRA